MKIKITELKKDGLQVRVALDEQTVADYSDAMRDGAKFPPVKVFSDGESYWLADGFHRVEAALRAGASEIEAEVTQGKFKDSLLFALGANSNHGLRRTNADKRRALEVAWENRRVLFGKNDPSAKALARACAVHRNTAFTFLQDFQVVQNVLPAERHVIGIDGKQYPVRSHSLMPVRQQPQADKSHLLDRNGRELPKNVIPAFERIDDCKAVENLISQARCLIHAAMGDATMTKGFAANPAFWAYRQEVLIMLNNAYNFAKAARPYCVCPICSGYGGGTGFGDGCKACHGRGWQTKDEFERNPSEYKGRVNYDN